MVRILYFARIRQLLGCSSEDVTLPESLLTVGDLAHWLSTRDAAGAAAFGDLRTLRAALDQTHVSLETPLANAREIAFFPPVTGG